MTESAFLILWREAILFHSKDGYTLSFLQYKNNKGNTAPPKVNREDEILLCFVTGRMTNEDGNLISINTNMPYQAASNELNPLASKSDWDKLTQHDESGTHHGFPPIKSILTEPAIVSSRHYN